MTSRRVWALSVALLALAPGAAVAEVALPPWPADADQAAVLTAKTASHAHFGGLRGSASIQVYVAPDRQGQLTLSTVTAPVAADARDAAASAELGELAASARALGAQIESSAQRHDAPGHFLEATIRWRDPALGIRQLGRTVIAATADTLIAVTGECVLGLDAPPAIEQACSAALASLEPAVDAADRVPLALVANPPPGTAPTTTRSAPPSEAPRLDAPGIGLAPMTITPAPHERDRRPVYLGLGIFVLAMVFWWNRRQRDRFDREDAGEPRRPRRRPDDDADDLHAAARGDASKDE